MDAGSPTITVVAAPGGHNGFRVSNRGTAWGYAADFRRDQGDNPWDMNMGANTYRIVVRGTAPAGTVMILQARDNPWNTLFRATAGANGQFVINERINNTIINNITSPTDPPGRETAQFRTGFRVSTERASDDDPHVDYEVHDFIVTRL
jgi:ribosomal protein S11